MGSACGGGGGAKERGGLVGGGGVEVKVGGGWKMKWVRLAEFCDHGGALDLKLATV